MHKPNQFALLAKRRFAPIFFTQFFGAFNDNIYKGAVMILIALMALNNSALQSSMLINLAAGLFILPFFIFSATAGQIADKYEKSKLVRYTKLFEIIIMCFAAASFYLQNVVMQLGVLFLLGFQATLFGPLKYSILPQHLHSEELLGGNAMVETATFIAILLGTILGGLLIAARPYGEFWVSVTLILVAVAGWLSSLAVPSAPAAAPHLKVSWNIITQTYKNIRFARKKPTVFLSILGISWFWLYGALYLAQMPDFCIHILGGDAHLVTFFMSLFSVGIGVGALLCEWISRGRIEKGLITLGALGLTVFGVDLFFAVHHYPLVSKITVTHFLFVMSNWRIVIDLFLLGMFGGFYTVPLYTLMQARSNSSCRSRIVSANNILNAVFMVVAALMAMGLLRLGLTIPELFLVISLLNAVVLVYIYFKLPVASVRFLLWILLRVLYRIRFRGVENIPTKGPAILVCNHVSYLDAVLICVASQRQVRFLIDSKIYRIPVVNYFFHISKAIPVNVRKEDPELLNRAYDSVANALARGELVGLFPEGKITYDGNISEFKPGIRKILARTPVPVVPMALQGLWGSWLSRDKKRFWRFFQGRIWPRVNLIIGKSLPPSELTAVKLQQIVQEMRGDYK